MNAFKQNWRLLATGILAGLGGLLAYRKATKPATTATTTVKTKAYAAFELKAVLPSPIWDTITIISDYAWSFANSPMRLQIATEYRAIFTAYIASLKSNVINLESCPDGLIAFMQDAPYGSIIWYYYYPPVPVTKQKNRELYLICQENGRRVLLHVPDDNWLIMELTYMGRSLRYNNTDHRGCDYIIENALCESLRRDLIQLKLMDAPHDDMTLARIVIPYEGDTTNIIM